MGKSSFIVSCTCRVLRFIKVKAEFSGHRRLCGAESADGCPFYRRTLVKGELTTILGAILGIVLEEELKDIAFYFFAALSGIFLYISLALLFPVLQDMIDDHVIVGN